MADPLKGKLAIITGSSRGIGAGIARALASRGASVLINYASENSEGIAQDLARSLAKEHAVQTSTIQADLLDPVANVPKIVQHAVEVFSDKHTNPETGKLQIDIIVNNAALAGFAPLGAIAVEDFDRHYKMNVLAPILLVQEAMPYLPSDRSGRIVNISSACIQMGAAAMTLYSGSKGALEAMTKVWATELAERCTVNAVQVGNHEPPRLSPITHSIKVGPTTTDLTVAAPDSLREYMRPWVEIAPLMRVSEKELAAMSERDRQHVKQMGGRRATVEEIGNVVLLLCMKESGWITGDTIMANGGMF